VNVIVSKSAADTTLGNAANIAATAGDLKLKANNDAWMLNATLAAALGANMGIGGSFNVNVFDRQATVNLTDGTLKAGDTMKFMATGAQFTVVEVGRMRALTLEPCEEIKSGEVGYITASIKSVVDARVGDTVTKTSNEAKQPLPGYKKVNSMVFCGVYPADGADYEALREALEKLQRKAAAQRRRFNL